MPNEPYHAVHRAGRRVSPGEKHQALVDVESTLPHRPTAVSCYIYVHGEVQTALVQFVVDLFYKQVSNKSATTPTGTKSKEDTSRLNKLRKQLNLAFPV